jgi:uncharacterized membrane protein YhhN
VFLPLLIASATNNHHLRHIPSKLLCSTSFVIGPLFMGTPSSYRSLITGALLLSFVGDICLLPSSHSHRASKHIRADEADISAWFKIGILAFAMTHALYILAFATHTRSISWSILASTFLASVAFAKGVGILYPSSLSSRVGNPLNLRVPADMRHLLAIYVVIISLMLGMAAATAAPVSNWPRQRLLGAIMFVLSDVFAAYDTFGAVDIRHGEYRPSMGRHGWMLITFGYGLYFCGQMVLAGTLSWDA